MGDGKLLVAENLAITVGGGPGGSGDKYSRSTEVIGLDLDILGESVNFRIGVGQGQSRLADIVPLARVVCTKITDIVVEKAHSEGDYIPCDKDCSACCRYLVPLSVPEAFRLSEEISGAPSYRRDSMRRACFLAAQRVLNHKPPTLYNAQVTQASSVSPSDMYLVSSWYASLELACPFLCRGVCTIYEQRPLACREHFIKGSIRACGGGRGTAEMVKMPVQMVSAIAKLASELEDTSIEAIMLPLALAWCEENPERDERTWPAAMIVERFIEIVQAMASENSTTVTASV